MSQQPSQFMIYLAGPIDGISDDESKLWRDALAEEFPEVLFFFPNLAYKNAKTSNAHLVDHMNRHAINCSTALLANLRGPGRGFGTIREIEWARSKGKRCAVVSDPSDIGPLTLMTYDVALAETPAQAMTDLLTWLTDMVNQPPTMLGFPFFMPQPPDEDGQDD